MTWIAFATIVARLPTGGTSVTLRAVRPESHEHREMAFTVESSAWFSPHEAARWEMVRWLEELNAPTEADVW